MEKFRVIAGGNNYVLGVDETLNVGGNRVRLQAQNDGSFILTFAVQGSKCARKGSEHAQDRREEITLTKDDWKKFIFVWKDPDSSLFRNCNYGIDTGDKSIEIYNHEDSVNLEIRVRQLDGVIPVRKYPKYRSTWVCDIPLRAWRRLLARFSQEF